jgi:hypothetical protein
MAANPLPSLATFKVPPSGRLCRMLYLFFFTQNRFALLLELRGFRSGVDGAVSRIMNEIKGIDRKRERQRGQGGHAEVDCSVALLSVSTLPQSAVAILCRP